MAKLKLKDMMQRLAVVTGAESHFKGKLKMNASIYVIGCEISGMYKIGRSANVEQRLNQIISHSGLSCSIEYLSKPCSNSTIVEKEAHNLCVDRAKGEWFNCELDVAIKSVKNAYDKFAQEPIDDDLRDESKIKRFAWSMACSLFSKSKPCDVLMDACNNFDDDNFIDDVISVCNDCLYSLTGSKDKSFENRDDVISFLYGYLDLKLEI